MAMHTYPLVESTAFLIDHHVAAYLNLVGEKKSGHISENIQGVMDQGVFDDMAQHGTLPDEYCNLDSAKDAMETLGIECVYLSKFEGCVKTLFNDRAATPMDISMSDDILAYLQPVNEPTLFSQAYECSEALKDEFACALRKAALPETFDWWRHIVSISGTYSC